MNTKYGTNKTNMMNVYKHKTQRVRLSKSNHFESSLKKVAY